ncbi:MAG: OmpA family protein, partial [Bacteroidota bacterium]
MKKILLFKLLVCLSFSAYANNYRVEISVFEKRVANDYFYDVEDVQLAIDVNDLYRYYVGDFSDINKAEMTKKELVGKGYRYAKVVDLKAERANCSASCKAPLYVQNIFFDFDRSNLRTKSKSDLASLATLMKDNPDYKVELSAHTDARGSTAYNTALSQHRATSAKEYLIAQGISANRIMTSTFGETSPIAKNDVNGKDSPAGRQFNRRVVVTVMKGNGKIVPNVVVPIDVPDVLKI